MVKLLSKKPSDGEKSTSPGSELLIADLHTLSLDVTGINEAIHLQDSVRWHV